MVRIMSQPVSKYEEERNGGVFSTLDRLRKAEEEKQLSENNYTGRLKSDYEKFRADANNDQKVDYDEYHKFILDNPPKETMTAAPSTPIKDDAIRVENTLLISVIFLVVLVCFTVIICTWMVTRKSKQQ